MNWSEVEANWKEVKGKANLENAPLGANIAQGIDIFWD